MDAQELVNSISTHWAGEAQPVVETRLITIIKAVYRQVRDSSAADCRFPFVLGIGRQAGTD
jgi:hypothetical protein